MWRGVEAHTKQRYALSVSALVPHIEGVITDWIHAQMPNLNVPGPQKEKTKMFRDIVATGARRTFADQRIADKVIEFILDGPVLQTFRDWWSPVSGSFPNRHVIGHGRYEPAFFNEENSVKVFLILDTLHAVMSVHKNA